MDSEGNDIVEGGQLGLLLYRGGTVCNHRWNRDFTYKEADIICRLMNFTRAVRWTNKERFDIQSNYDINLGDVECDSRYSDDWDRCRNKKKPLCGHDEDVFLSCTGNSSRTTSDLHITIVLQ